MEQFYVMTLNGLILELHGPWRHLEVRDANAKRLYRGSTTIDAVFWLNIGGTLTTNIGRYDTSWLMG